MSHLPIRQPINPNAVIDFLADAAAGRLVFNLDTVAPVVGLNLAYLETACHQFVVEHVDYHGNLGFTADQVRLLLARLGSGDLDDATLAEAFLRDQSQPDRLNRHLRAVT